MVLSILSLLTRPCLMRRRLGRCATSAVSTVLGCSMTCLELVLCWSEGDALLGDCGLDLGIVAADELHAGEVAEVSGAQREAKVEELFLGLASALLELGDRQFAQSAQIVALHYDATSASCSARVMILVEIGSF